MLKPRRHDADNRIRITVERDVASERIRVGAETSLPQAMAQNHDAWRSGAVFFRRKCATKSGLGACHLKEIGREPIADQQFRLAHYGKVELRVARRSEERHVGKEYRSRWYV